MECRAVTEAAARLRCFDAAAAALDDALARRTVAVTERAQVQKDRRAAFGVRRLRPAPREETGTEVVRAEKIDKIDSLLRGASVGGDGNWVFSLQDGSVWRQTDALPIGRAPRPGDAVTVLRAAFGSYRLRVAGQPAVRVRRTN